MTVSPAVDWASRGIRLNAIAPGPVPTSFAWDVPDSGSPSVVGAMDAHGGPAGRHSTTAERQYGRRHCNPRVKAHSGREVAGDRCGERQRPIDERIGGDDSVDETHPPCLIGADHSTGGEPIGSVRRSANARKQPERAQVTRRHPDRDKGGDKDGLRRCEPDVSGKPQPQAAPSRGAIHGRNDRDVHPAKHGESAARARRGRGRLPPEDPPFRPRSRSGTSLPRRGRARRPRRQPRGTASVTGATACGNSTTCAA